VLDEKIKRPEDLPRWAEQLPRPLVFSNGVFDLLHRGHVTYLEQARALGAALVVGVNTDASAKRLAKGPGRPFNTLQDRVALLAALQSVDAVTWFDEDTPAALIEALRPEVLVKGGDWTVPNIVGGKETLARGGRVVSLPFEHQRSTTDLLAKIRKS
jgi:rfaE bifunctional protein nucleotidyltransferase chain/domain